MNVLHFLSTGGAGGIESLVRDYADYSSHNNYYIFFWAGGRNCERMKAAGHNVLILYYKKKDFFKTYLRLKEIIKEKGIDAIVSHHATPIFWIYSNLLKNKNNGLRTYIYAHSNLEDMYGSGFATICMRKILFSMAYKKCDALIAISDSVKQSVVARGFDIDKIKVVYNGVDCQKFINDGIRDSKIVNIIFVGRLIRQKGVHLLIEALKQLDDELMFKCDIVGDGPVRSELEVLTNSLCFKNEVKFHGTRDDVPDMLAKAHIFVHPAIWEEGFGISVVEAMAAGTVPIAFRKGAIPEIIDDKENGFIVNKCDAHDLAGTIKKGIKLIGSDEFEIIKERAKEKALKFDMSRFVDELDNVICIKL